MDQNLQRQIQTRLEELPVDVRRAIASADVDKKIRETGSKHSLHLDQIGNLSDEVYMVMLGLVEPGEFADNIQKEVNVTQEKAEAIAQEISSSLFIPIRESMQEFTEDRALHETILEEGRGQTKPLSIAPASVITSSSPLSSAKPPATPLPTVLKPAEIHPADMMLTQKTVTVAPPPAPKPPVSPASPAPAGAPPVVSNPAPNTAPAKPTPPAPKPYATDPYREQPE